MSERKNVGGGVDVAIVEYTALHTPPRPPATAPCLALPPASMPSLDPVPGSAVSKGRSSARPFRRVGWADANYCDVPVSLDLFIPLYARIKQRAASTLLGWNAPPCAERDSGVVISAICKLGLGTPCPCRKYFSPFRAKPGWIVRLQPRHVSTVLGFEFGHEAGGQLIEARPWHTVVLTTMQ